MEIQILGRDVTVFYKEVQNFPDGVAAAFHELEDLHPSVCERSFFGITYEGKDRVLKYLAAVEERYRGEGAKFGCPTFVIAQGAYLTETIPNFMGNLHSIPNAFAAMLTDPRRDGEFPCVEWYKNEEEMTCMIRIKTVGLVN